MPRPVSEVTVRRQTGIARKRQAKAASKRQRLRGGRRPKRQTAKQKALVRKRKASGFFRKVAALRSSLDLPATIVGSISHRTEYIDLILEVASGFKDEKQSASAFAKLFIEKDPAFSNTDTGMAAILFEAYLFEKAEDVVEQFLETQLEGQDTTFLAIFEGQIKDEPLEKLAKGVKGFCTFEALVKAGDTNHADGTVSDVTILECTPKRGAASKARKQTKTSEPKLRTEGLLPETTADYEAVIAEGGISDNAFMYLFPSLWEAATGANGDIRTATEATGMKWYCYEGIWLPDTAGLDEAKKNQEPTDDNISNYIRDTLSGTDRFTTAKSLFGVAKRSFKGLTMKQFTAAWNALVKEGYLKKRSDGKYMWESTDEADEFTGTVKADIKSPQDAAKIKAKAASILGKFRDATPKKVKHYLAGPKGDRLAQAIGAEIEKEISLKAVSDPKAWLSIMSTVINRPNVRKQFESVDEATLDKAIKKSKLRRALVKNLKALLKDWMKKSSLGDLTNIKSANVFIDGDKVQVNVEPFKGDRKQFNTRMDLLESIQEGFEALFSNPTRANRFAREIRIHARTIKPNGTQVYYEAKEADHTKETTHEEAITELCRKHGGKKKKKAKKPVKEEEDTHAFVAGPFLGDAEPRLIHNGHCEVVGFPKALQSGPLYLESEEGFQSKFLAWTVRREGTDDGKVLVHVGQEMYRLPASLSEVKGLLDKMEEFYEDLPDEFDCMVGAFLEEYCQEKGDLLCTADIESTGLDEALEDWTSHEFIADRDTRINARCRMRRLALGEERGQGMGRGGNRQGDGGATTCICPECGTRMPHERGTPCAESKCPKCGTSMVGEDLDTVSTLRGLSEAAELKAKIDAVGLKPKEYRFSREPHGVILTVFKPGGLKKAKKAFPDAKLTTSKGVFPARLVLKEGTDEAKGSLFKCQECGKKFRKKITKHMLDAKCPKCGSVDTLPVDYFGEDLDEATVSAMVSGFQAMGLGDIRTEKATTRVVKCPKCGGKVLAATGYCVSCEKKTVTAEDLDEAKYKKGQKVKWTAPDGTKMTGSIISDVGPNYDLKVRVTSPKPKKGEEEVLVKRGRLKEDLDEAEFLSPTKLWLVEPRKGGKMRLTPFKKASEAGDALKAAKKKGKKGVGLVSGKGVRDAALKAEKKDFVAEEDLGDYDLSEAASGLTLATIRLPGEHQAFRVLKGKSLVGFLKQTGKNTATEEHPWKAFGVSRGQVGQKIGFFYKRDGGKSAALQAIAKTGLESIEVEIGCGDCGCEWTTTLTEAASVPSCPQCGSPGARRDESIDEAKLSLADFKGKVEMAVAKKMKAKGYKFAVLILPKDGKPLYAKTAMQAAKVSRDYPGSFVAPIDKLIESIDEQMTTVVAGVGKVKEPTHMKALARKAGKSGKVALRLWGEAQLAANKQYPDLKAAKGKGGVTERRYYKVVTAIFKKMLGLGKEESEQTDPIIAEVLCHSCRSATDVFLYPHSVGVCGECGSVHVTPTGDAHYATEEEIEAAKSDLSEFVEWPGTEKPVKKGQKVKVKKAYVARDMNDKTVTIKKGTRGQVSYVGTQGEFHVKWATGVETHDMMSSEVTDYIGRR